MNGALLDKLANKAFEGGDLEKSGTLDFKELYIALLKVYDKVNRKLPGNNLKPPDVEEVHRLMKKFDMNEDHSLDLEEFRKFVKVSILEPQDWRESLVVKIGTSLLLKLAFFPLLAYGMKEGLLRAGLDSAEKLPTTALSHALEMLGRFATKIVDKN